MRQILLPVVAFIATFCHAGVISAGFITFDFESLPLGSAATQSVTVDGVTLNISATAGQMVQVADVSDAPAFQHALISTPVPRGPMFVDILSADPVEFVSLQFGDRFANGDNDIATLTAFSGLGGTGFILGLDSQLYPSTSGINQSPYPVGMLSLSASGIMSIKLEAFSPNNTNGASVFWDNFTIETQASVVPEPSSFALLGLGAAGLGAIQRRRKSRQSGDVS